MSLLHKSYKFQDFFFSPLYLAVTCAVFGDRLWSTRWRIFLGDDSVFIALWFDSGYIFWRQSTRLLGRFSWWGTEADSHGPDYYGPPNFSSCIDVPGCHTFLRAGWTSDWIFSRSGRSEEGHFCRILWHFSHSVRMDVSAHFSAFDDEEFFVVEGSGWRGRRESDS